jgi:hypothetical protein
MSKVTRRDVFPDNESDTLAAFFCVCGDSGREDDIRRFDCLCDAVVVIVPVDAVVGCSSRSFVTVDNSGVVSIAVVVVPVTSDLMKIAVVTVINSSAGGLILVMFGSTL